MLIGEKIKRLRKNKNVTQTQLAEALSVSPQSVSKWETHLSAPDISLLPVIARYFGITMDELFGYRLDGLNEKERLIRFLVDNGILRFGEFRLKSGRLSPYLIHGGYTLTGSQISKLGEFYARCIRDQGLDANCLLGIDAGEVPLVVATGMTLFNKYGVDAVYCVDCDLETAAFASREITLIADTFTSGKTLSEGLERIGQRTGKYPSHVVVCVDRMESCEHSALSAKHDLEKRFGIKVHSMVNAEDILRAMENGVISSEEHREKLKAYLAQYKGE